MLEPVTRASFQSSLFTIHGVNRLNFGRVKNTQSRKNASHLATEKSDSLWKDKHSQNTWDI